MSAFGKELVLFSPVTGAVIQNGQPVAGAKVSRTTQWKDSREVEQTVSNQSGEFNFKAKTARSMMWSLLPHNPVVMQTISIEVNGQRYEAWEYQKGDYELNSEADGKALNMLCDLDQEAQSHAINQLFSYWGLCTLR